MPLSQQQIDQFTSLYGVTKDPQLREQLEKQFVRAVEANSANATESIRTLINVSGRSGARDLTRHHSAFQAPVIPPLEATQVEAAVDEAIDEVPWWRRAAAGTLEAIDWWQTEAVEPTAALALAGMFAVTPGEQGFEKRTALAAQNLASEKGIEVKDLTLKDNIDAIGDAYRKSTLPWGAKGLLELIADPLNLLGLGIPGKIAARSPWAIKQALLPLRAIDRAPEVAVNKLLELPGGLKVGGKQLTPGVQNIPGVKALVAPHHSTQVREVYGRVYAAVGEAFGGPTLRDGTAEDTARVLSDMSRWPQDTGPYSLRNVFNHLAETFGERAWAGKDGTGGILGRLKDSAPQKAANDIAALVAAQESRAIQRGRFSLETGKEIAGGGKRLAGEVVEKGKRAKRRESFQSIFQKLNDDERWAKGLAVGADNYLYKFENFYLKWVEPNIIRPFSLAHLSFAGFLPMNMLEDIGMSTLGLGTSPFGVSDEMWSLVTAGLDTPQHLISAEGQVRNTLDLNLGRFKENEPGLMEKASLAMGGIFVKKSSEYGWAYRRATWYNLFNKELTGALRKHGINDTELDALRNLVHSDIPTGLSHLNQDLGSMAWQAASTGDPQAIRNLRALATSDRMIQKAQSALFSEMVNIPPGARDIFRRAVLREGGINSSNAEDVLQKMNEELVEWHRLATPEGIRASYLDFVDAIGKRPAVTVGDAHAQLTLLQNASDTLADMANEMRRNAKWRADHTAPSGREAIYRDTDDLTDNMVTEVRGAFEEATRRAQPKIDEILSSEDVVRTSAQREAVKRSINDIFEGYREISENLRKTWKEHLDKRRDLFETVAKDDRDEAFWIQVGELGQEIWDAEKVFRARAANNIRTGWNHITETVKFSSLSPKNRDVYRAGLQSQITSGENHYHELLTQIRNLEESMAALPESQQSARLGRINDLKVELRRVADDVLNLDNELSEFGRVRNTLLPSELREYDRAIRTLKKQKKLATENNLQHHVRSIDEQLIELASERETAFEQFIPPYAKQRWTTLTSRRKSIAASIEAATTEREASALRGAMRRNNAEINRFRKSVERGEASRNAVDFKTVTSDNINRIAIDLLEQLDGNLPATVDEAAALLTEMADSGHDASLDIVNLVAENAIGGDAVAERLYTRMAALTDIRQLNEMQQVTLRNLVTNPDALPTSVTTELAEMGMVTTGPRLRNGRFRFEVTEQGREALETLDQSAIDIEDVVSRMPPLQQKFQSTIDELLEQTETTVRKAVDIADNPPMRRIDESAVGGYFDKIANHLEARPELSGQMKAARNEASNTATEKYNQFYVNYDNRSTFDFIMQRFMPFWMYESRRWPRLIRLAGKRPVLAKHMALVGLDWDYGYTPTPFGFEFNPVKGTVVGGLRRTGSREFPELHGGVRGKVEQGLDFLGRGGFYFAPPITAPFDIAQGEGSNILPPPISLILHGLVAGVGATGADIPDELAAATFSSRYTNYLTDQVMADRFSANPNDVRRKAEEGDEDAIAMMNLARSEAAARMIVLNQSSVLRYRPQAKREFIEDTEEAVSLYTGVSEETQEELKRLGIPLYSIIPVSGFQRKAIRESIPNYDAWIAANISLRPVEEQRKLRIIDEFWTNVERFQTSFEDDMAQVNENWVQQKITGSEAREEYSRLQADRAAKFQDLKSNTRYSLVPITTDERAAWAKEHGSPAPMVHPIDEILEGYYAITPDQFIDPYTGQPDFGKFFDAREAHLDTYAETGFDEVARQSLQKGGTDLERSLRNASPWIREYFGIRDTLLEELNETDPQAVEDYNVYRRLRIMAANVAGTPEEKKLLSQARAIIRRSPELPMIERKVRKFREQFREENPEMELVYQQWIARPDTIPSAGGGTFRAGGGTVRQLNTIGTLQRLGVRR